MHKMDENIDASSDSACCSAPAWAVLMLESRGRRARLLSCGSAKGASQGDRGGRLAALIFAAAAELVTPARLRFEPIWAALLRQGQGCRQANCFPRTRIGFWQMQWRADAWE